MQDPERYRRTIGVQRLLDMVRLCYWDLDNPEIQTRVLDQRPVPLSAVPIVSAARGASKGPALERACQGFEAGAVLVVGDNARDEVAEALSRGYHACWVARGEFAATAAPAAWRVDGLGELLRWVGAAPTDLVEPSPGGGALG